MQTPRSPSASGSLASMAAAARRSTLNVPIRFTRTTASKGSNACGPRLPAVFSAHPMPAQQTAIRRPSAACTAASTSSAFVTSQATKRAPSSAASASPRSALRSAIVSSAPAARRRRAVAAPRPEAPPATSARDPSMRMGADPIGGSAGTAPTRPAASTAARARRPAGSLAPARIAGSAGVAGEQRRDRQEQLVREPVGDERAQEPRAALAQQRPDAAGAQVGERGGGRGVVEAHDLDRRRRGGRVGRVRAGVHEHGLLRRLEQAGLPRDVEAAADQDRERVLGEAGRLPASAPLRAADEARVALRAQRAGADQHGVGERPQLEQQLEVGLRAQRLGPAVVGGAAVGRGDHVHEHERPIVGRALGRADLGEQLVRRARVFRKPGGTAAPGHRTVGPCSASLSFPGCSRSASPRSPRPTSCSRPAARSTPASPESEPRARSPPRSASARPCSASSPSGARSPSSSTSPPTARARGRCCTSRRRTATARASGSRRAASRAAAATATWPASTAASPTTPSRSTSG